MFNPRPLNSPAATEMRDVETLLILAQPVDPREAVPGAFDLLRSAAEALDLIARDHAAISPRQLADLLADARSCIDRAAQMTPAIHPVASPCERSVVDVTDVLCGLYPLLRMMCRSDHRLTMTASPTLPAIPCEAVTLEAVLQSLVIHACRETPGGGDITLHAVETPQGDGRSSLQVVVRSRRRADAPTDARDPCRRASRDRIGLSLAIRLVQTRGGELHVDRPDDGLFVITLRLPALRGRRRPAV